MRMQDNTIFMAGGGSGIRRGAKHPGMRYFVLDVSLPEAIQNVEKQIVSELPALNCVLSEERCRFTISSPKLCTMISPAALDGLTRRLNSQAITVAQ